MLSWLERNIFYNNDYISKYEIHIIRSAFGESGSYGSSFEEICLVQNTYTGHKILKGDNSTPIQLYLLKNDKNFMTKRFFQCYPPDIG